MIELVAVLSLTAASNTNMHNFLLPNQTWVCSPSCSKAKLLTPACGVGSAVFMVGTIQGGPVPHALQNPNYPMGFREAFLKAR